MAKPNYQFEKRQRDLAKKKKKEEKRLKKTANQENKSTDAPSPEPPESAPGEGTAAE